MAEAVQYEDVGLRDACGVFGCVAAGNWPTQLSVPHIISFGLVGLQHRGQESAGIVTSSGDKGCHYSQKKGMGLVNSIFHEDDLVKLKGNLGIAELVWPVGTSSEVSSMLE